MDLEWRISQGECHEEVILPCPQLLEERAKIQREKTKTKRGSLIVNGAILRTV